MFWTNPSVNAQINALAGYDPGDPLWAQHHAGGRDYTNCAAQIERW